VGATQRIDEGPPLTGWSTAPISMEKEMCQVAGGDESRGGTCAVGNGGLWGGNEGD